MGHTRGMLGQSDQGVRAAQSEVAEVVKGAGTALIKSVSLIYSVTTIIECLAESQRWV
jgi:hypothetical protein